MKEKLAQITETYVINGVLVIPMKPIELTDAFRLRQWKEYRLPNLDKVVNFFGAVIDELCALGDIEGARRIFSVVFDYIISETHQYANVRGNAWQEYASLFDAGSPCCMCDAQSELSRIASRNGFDDLAHYVVSVHCPVSPNNYRRDASTLVRKEEDWKSWHAHNAEVIESWNGPIFDYFWTESHTRNR